VELSRILLFEVKKAKSGCTSITYRVIERDQFVFFDPQKNHVTTGERICSLATNILQQETAIPKRHVTPINLLV
jgi:hypothetical protein